MEKRDKTAEEDDGFSSKKIHVRSKDPSKIARQFEKSEKSKNGVRNGSKVFLNPFHIFDPDLLSILYFSFIWNGLYNGFKMHSCLLLLGRELKELGNAQD